MHGGDIYNNKVDVDFSVNINPLGPSVEILDALKEAVVDVSHYPDIHCAKLREAIAERYNVSPDWIICGNGVSELIHMINDIESNRRTLTLDPTYDGYKAFDNVVSLKLEKEEGYRIGQTPAETIMDFIIDSEKESGNTINQIMLCNPNNPTGELISCEAIEKLASFCESTDRLLIVDESYMELTKGINDSSAIRLVNKYDHLVVLTSYTKSYAIPGVRIGFSICKNQSFNQELLREMPEWSVSVFAQKAGIVASKQKNYLLDTIELIEIERNWLTDKLKAMGTKVYDSQANFIYFEENRVNGLKEKLLGKGILIRDYLPENNTGYRIAVKTRVDNEKLIEALTDILSD